MLVLVRNTCCIRTRTGVFGALGLAGVMSMAPRNARVSIMSANSSTWGLNAGFGGAAVGGNGLSTETFMFFTSAVVSSSYAKRREAVHTNRSVEAPDLVGLMKTLSSWRSI